KDALAILQSKFDDVNYLNAKEQLPLISLYASALYLQIERLSKKYDLSNTLTKSGGLSGISKRGFTKKDFMDRYTTGSKKLIWGNPFLLK
ncbi:type I-Fv CRISPR-associated protein Cas5fv, partial [Acinetobacter baumannii]